ncbi:GapS4a family protein [Paenibacillus sp. FA6]|uniref:GapS4a family protein n=1 Tax=Paenibacillus sp. FA6 TaxID=3413029 RepID=UPI003F65892A
MSGEKSKFSGEYGERIATQLLNLIGWNNALSGKDIPCIHNEVHKGADGNPRQKHGVDFIVKYECPLVSRLESNVLISVKHREGYPGTAKGITTEFKSYLKDIAEATDCYPAHELFRQRIKGTKKIDTANVIMWFNSIVDKENNGVISELQNFRNSDNVNYKTVYLVDNKKANFLFSSIKYVQNRNTEFFFYYPDTGFNMDTTERSHQGRILPVQYINSPIQLFKLVESTGDCLIITCEDTFSIEYFDRLLQLARLITESWASKIVIAFPDYNNYKNDEEISKSISKIRDTNFAQKVFVEKYSYLDFRNIGGTHNDEDGR